MPALTSRRPEERKIVVDTGASVHMMSKKELSSEEKDTVKRSRTRTVVLTANGEVLTHEETQVFVHDLNLFVPVHSYEWVSSQEPRLAKDGTSIICNTDNFVPLVVPGLSTNPESSSSPASLSQDSLRKDAAQAPRELVHFASSSSSRSVSERSDERASRRLVPFPEIQNQKKRGVTGGIRTTRWQMFLAGYRISKKI